MPRISSVKLCLLLLCITTTRHNISHALKVPTPSTYSSMIGEAVTRLNSAQRVVIFSGAGMSAESGIDTFRSSDNNGFWNGIFGTFALAYGGTPFGWNMTPGWVWSYFVDSFYGPIARATPHRGYDALAKMRREKFNEGNFEVITMNVDGMHGNEDYVHEVHGTVQRFRCIKCAHPIHISDVMESKANPPKCGQCGGYPRPDVTLFTEALPQDEWLASLSAVRKLSEGDVLIIVGTSSVVYPAANLPVVAKRRGATLIEINPQENTPLADLVDIHLRGGAGDMLTDLADGVCKSAKTY